MKSSFLPINNHYTSIDLSTLKTKNFNVSTISNAEKIKKLQNSSILELARYSGKILNNPNIKDPIIVKKEVIPQEINIKPRYFDVIDMLNVNNIKKEENNSPSIIQKYLKSFTTLDTELAQSKNILYQFRNSRNKNVDKILEYSFFEMSSVISAPYIYITPNNVVINLFLFVINKNTKNFLNKNLNKLQGLSSKLSRYFKKPVTLELTQLYSVSHNSNILVHILGKLGLSRKNSFSRITNRFLKLQSKKIFFRSNQNKFSKFATILTGVNIKLAGRLMRGKIVPRRTVKKIQYGSLARSKSNYVSTARMTQKNKRGSFSFTVSMGHKFF